MSIINSPSAEAMPRVKRKREMATEEASFFPRNPSSNGHPKHTPIVIPTTYLIGAGPLLQDRFRAARFDKFSSEHLGNFDTSLSNNQISQLLRVMGIPVCDVTSPKLVAKLCDITQTMPDGTIIPCFDDPTFIYALTRQTIERHKGGTYAMIYDTLSPISPRSIFDIEAMFMAQHLEEIPRTDVDEILEYFVAMKYAIRLDDLGLLEDNHSDAPQQQQEEDSRQADINPRLVLTPHYYTFAPRLQIDPEFAEARAIMGDSEIARTLRWIVYEARCFMDYAQSLHRSCSGSASTSGLLPSHLLWPELDEATLQELNGKAAIAARAVVWAYTHLRDAGSCLKPIAGMELYKSLSASLGHGREAASAILVAQNLFDVPNDWHLDLDEELEERVSKLARNDAADSTSGSMSQLSSQALNASTAVSQNNASETTWDVFEFHSHCGSAYPKRVAGSNHRYAYRFNRPTGELHDDPIVIDDSDSTTSSPWSLPTNKATL